MLENVLGPESTYLRRLGALSALLCGPCALLGVALAVVQPCAANVGATACAAAVALAGAWLSRRS